MSFFHDITKMSDNGLKGMQRAVRDRLADEDAQPAGQEKIYGVREYPDWKAQSDEMETELDRRGISYDKVPW